MPSRVIVWVKGVQDEYIRVKVLGSLGGALGIRVQSLVSGEESVVRLWNVRAIEFDEDLVVEITLGVKINPTDFVQGPL